MIPRGEGVVPLEGSADWAGETRGPPRRPAAVEGGIAGRAQACVEGGSVCQPPYGLLLLSRPTRHSPTGQAVCRPPPAEVKAALKRRTPKGGRWQPPCLSSEALARRIAPRPREVMGMRHAIPPPRQRRASQGGRKGEAGKPSGEGVENREIVPERRSTVAKAMADKRPWAGDTLLPYESEPNGGPRETARSLPLPECGEGGAVASVGTAPPG